MRLMASCTVPTRWTHCTLAAASVCQRGEAPIVDRLDSRHGAPGAHRVRRASPSRRAAMRDRVSPGCSAATDRKVSRVLPADRLARPVDGTSTVSARMPITLSSISRLAPPMPSRVFTWPGQMHRDDHVTRREGAGDDRRRLVQRGLARRVRHRGAVALADRARRCSTPSR